MPACLRGGRGEREMRRGGVGGNEQLLLCSRIQNSMAYYWQGLSSTRASVAPFLWLLLLLGLLWFVRCTQISQQCARSRKKQHKGAQSELDPFKQSATEEDFSFFVLFTFVGRAQHTTEDRLSPIWTREGATSELCITANFLQRSSFVTLITYYFANCVPFMHYSTLRAYYSQRMVLIQL